MSVTIRPAAPGDAEAAAALMAQLAEHASGTPADGVQDRLCQILKEPSQAIFVAQDEVGHVIGLLTVGRQQSLWHSGASALIQELVVDRAARRRGVGRALIQAAIEWARAAGCSEIGVSTELDNQDAQAFYRRTGFDESALLLERHFED